MPTPALFPDPLSRPAVVGDSRMFKPVVGEGINQVAVGLTPGVGDLSVLVPELDCAESRNTLDVSGDFFWVRWCEAGRASLSIADLESGAGQSYPITVVEPSPTPVPAATPTPGPPHDPIIEFDSLREVSALHREMPERERQIRELPWIADGLLYTEHRAAQGLVYLAKHGGDYFPKFMEHTWVTEGRNKPAMESFGGLANWHQETFQKVVKHPSVRDGISDEESKTVATFLSAAWYNPDLLEHLLDPEKVTVEERIVDLPLAGPVSLTIVRTKPGATRSMDLLETAVRTVEDFMSVPFPRQQVVYLFEDAMQPGGSGDNFYTFMVSQPYFDGYNYNPEWTLPHIAHEVSHYYWMGRDIGGTERWVSEGAATFIEGIQAHTLTGWPLQPQRRPCVHADSIAELETLRPIGLQTPGYGCYYSLGERLFHGLYKALGETEFQSGFRRLYLLSRRDNPEDECVGVHLGICHVKAAFKYGATQEVSEIVDQVLVCWYDGDKSACPDNSPAAPLTPVYGPISGEIPHHPDDGELALPGKLEQSGNVMIEVTFDNPYAPNESNWIHGIWLQASTDWSSHRVLISSWKTWRHGYYSADGDYFGGERWDDAPSIDVSKGGSNHLRIIIEEKIGWFYVNNRFLGNIDLNLGKLPDTDLISLVVVDDGRGINHKEGHSTRYRDFTIWKWHPDLFELPEDD